MIQLESGSFMLGFTEEMKCSNCNNATPFQIRQDYVKQRLLMIPILTSNNAIFKLCPICDKKEYLIKSKPMYAGSDKKNQVIELLERGKKYTKSWMSKLNTREKELVLKRLNGFKAYSLVRYLSE